MSAPDYAAAPPAASDLGTDGASLALVIVWCREEPERVGEVLLLQPDASHVHLFGRGDDAPSDPAHRRLQPVRQRPGENVPVAPLEAKRLSREQLLLQRLDDARLAVENRGRRALLLRGLETTHAVLREGDVVQVEGQVVLLCTRRPALIPSGDNERVDATHTFGAADPQGLVGESPAAWELRAQAAQAARAAGHVLIAGPSGVGRRALGRAIHALGPRSAAPVVVADLVATPPELVAFELFGHDGPGDEGTPGLVEAAEGGTLILAGLDLLDPALAARVVALATDGSYTRTGDPRPRRADLRLVATCADPEQGLAEGLRPCFAAVVHVPALEARRDDLPLLARHLLQTGLADHPDLAARFLDATGAPRFAPGFVRGLLEYVPAGGVPGLEADLWHGLAVSPAEWIIAPPALAQRLAEADPTAPLAGNAAPRPADVPFMAGTLGSPATLPAVTRPGTFETPRPVAAPLGTPAGDARLLPPGLPRTVREALEALSPDERRLLQHLALGRGAGEIAPALCISVRAVRSQRAHLAQKLGLGAPARISGVASALARYLGPPVDDATLAR